MKASGSPAWAAATIDCSFSKWVGIFGESSALRGGCSRTAFHPSTQMDQFAKSRRAAKNSCGLSSYQLEDLPKGAPSDGNGPRRIQSRASARARKRQRAPDVLTPEEIVALLKELLDPLRTMIEW